MHFLVPTSTKPTRISTLNGNTTCTTIDHIWISGSNSFVSGILEKDITDHYPCFVFFPYFTEQNLNEKTEIKFRPFSDQNLSNLKLKLSEVDWNLEFEQNYLNDEICDIFCKKT